MKKYRTWYDNRIEEVEAVSESAKFVTVKDGFRNPGKSLKHPAKNTDSHYHDTWQEAHQFLIDRENAAITDHERQIAQHRETLKKLQEMSQP